MNTCSYYKNTSIFTLFIFRSLKFIQIYLFIPDLFIQHALCIHLYSAKLRLFELTRKNSGADSFHAFVYTVCQMCIGWD